ncbi:MAG TPA: DUF420 domain-containing protein [Tepidisphaeraceae bacterium]|nr:DUF420 domain-containing protein [Tepidisphaeraceae bacterium]
MNGKELLAAINATLNGSCAILLIAGYVMIRRQKVRAHVTLMISALVVSAIFLACYLYSQFAYGDRTIGLKPSPLRTFYLILLASHVLLAIGMLPPILMTVWRAYHWRWEAHKKIAKPTLAVWIYVSITGVMVYWMLYHLFPSKG